MSNLGTRIKRIMEDHGLIAADLARAAGVSPMAVSYWLDGTTTDIKFKYAEPIAIKYGYSARWIMTGKEPIKMDEEKEVPPESKPQLGIDKDVLATILRLVQESIIETGTNWGPEKTSQLVANLYALYLNTGELPNVRQAAQLEALR